MIAALTKRKESGELYVRPPDIEKAIEAAILLPHPTVIARISILEEDSPDYLRPECVVHLIRNACREGDYDAMNDMLAAFLLRCLSILERQIPDRRFPDAAGIREEVLGRLGEKFAIDGYRGSLEYLDFFECKFNRALKALRVSTIRKAKNHADRTEKLQELQKVAPGNFAQPSKVYSSKANQLSAARVQEALEAMSDEESEAFLLVHQMGYKVESIDPKEETAATKAGFSGRTIRTRLARAEMIFKQYTEYGHD